MMYYSTQPFLAWVLNHHFYGRVHFTWAAHPFHPYREPNPKSSNPYLMYADFYLPWRDDDQYDRTITSMRQSLRNGVLAKRALLHSSTTNFLKRVCEQGSPLLFFPVVYRIDVDLLQPSRLDSTLGFAAVGSHEVLIRDLDEHEFDVLFFEDHNDPTLAALSDLSCSRPDAVRLLRTECRS